ncbi:HK97 family phage prohead protease [Martelella mangrovi]|uniref:HK97 family phage prohead protease n=1 Tax=Martelella mangrovi TaxID=1397477 RepID=A0ABV2IGW7_9HYPH
MTLLKRAIVRRPEIRADGDTKTAVGYAALFNSDADIGGLFVERIAPGAFTDTLKNNDVRALIDHDPGRVIGRTSAGTLRLTEDDKGLRVEVDLPETTDGRDLAVLLERGDISGMSFGFHVVKQEWDETAEPWKRTIIAADLMEVSAVAFPAYDDTQLAMRDLEAAKKDRARTNFHAAARRLRMKATLDLRSRSKA